MRDTYVPNFKVPGKRKPSAMMWITVALCVLLPPVGLILLWGRVSCPLRGKVALTMLALTVMIAILTVYFERQASNNYVVPLTPVTNTYGGAQATPPAQAAPPTEVENAPAPESIAPANPLG